MTEVTEHKTYPPTPCSCSRRSGEGACRQVQHTQPGHGLHPQILLPAGQRGSADTLRLPHQAGCSSGGRGPAVVTRLEGLGREWGLSLQTPHLWPPGPKQPSGPTAPSGQSGAEAFCAWVCTKGNLYVGHT